MDPKKEYGNDDAMAFILLGVIAGFVSAAVLVYGGALMMKASQTKETMSDALREQLCLSKGGFPQVGGSCDFEKK